MNDGRDLPRGWAWAEIAEMSMPGETWNPRKADVDQFSYIDIEAVDNARQRIVAPKKLSADRAPSRARVGVKKGDVLFSLVRPYLKNIAVVPEELDGQVASTAFVAVRPAEGIYSSFVFNYLIQDSFIHSVPTYGNSPPAARDDEFIRLKIPVAPSEEQERISAKVDELLSDLDAGVAALERATANLKRYRAVVLKAAVEGKLTEQWRKAHPDVEPASKLLERILAERRRKWEKAQLAKYTTAGKPPPKGWKEKYPEPVAPDTSALSELPKGWCWTSIDYLVAQKNNSLRRGPFGSTIKKEYFVSDGYKVYEQQHAIEDNFELGNYFITEEKYRELSSFWLLPGDVIISCSGTIGRVAVVPSNARPGVINQALLKITLDPDVILVDYFKYVFAFRLRDLSVRGTGMNNFSGIEELKKMAFPLSCLDEQREVCTHLREVDSAIDRMEGQINMEMLRTKRLRQSILKLAFEGKLVPQDPNDLPAPRPGKWFIYALECEGGSIYIGQSQDVEERWKQHATGRGADWTQKHPPVKLVHWEEFDSLEAAVKREKDLKTGFGRKWLKREYAAGRTRQAGEPASILLERIRAARAASGKPARNGRGKRNRAA